MRKAVLIENIYVSNCMCCPSSLWGVDGAHYELNNNWMVSTESIKSLQPGDLVIIEDAGGKRWKIVEEENGEVSTD